MLGFKTPAEAQRFLSTHSAIYKTFNFQCHLISRPVLRILRDRASESWQDVGRLLHGFERPVDADRDVLLGES